MWGDKGAPEQSSKNGLTRELLSLIDTAAEDGKVEISPWDFMEREKIVHTTVLEKLGVLLILLGVPFSSAFYAAKFLIRGGKDLPPFSAYVFMSTLRWAYMRLNRTQLRLVIPLRPLREELALVKLRGPPPNNYNKLFAVDRASARWIGEVPDRGAEDPVVLYLHGGIYALKAIFAQIFWCISMDRRLNERGRRLSILTVDYTVTPYAKYPVQLNEAMAVYTELSKSCNKIILIGDSAGGNLAAAMLAKLSEEGRPASWGAIFVSPWMQLPGRNYGSYVENLDRDYIDVRDCEWQDFCTEEQLSDPMVNPISGTSSYWRPKMPARSAIVWGEWEILRDSSAEWAQIAGIPYRYQERHGVHDPAVVGPRTRGSKFVLHILDTWLADAQKGPNVEAPLPAPRGFSAARL